MSRRKFIVGLVGSVSNGKTTLVERLSGVNTKKHSSEQKEGRTVKLGYANLILWSCDACKKNYSTGQKTVNKECEACGEKCRIDYELSLVDAPGHSAFIKTMIRGSSVMEAAIVVTDVKQIPHQHQTLEHLAILEILGVRKVLVIQNKCDLVSKEECKTHCDELKYQFKSTVAENAPVIPVCAQRGINIGVVVNELYALCNQLSSSPPCFGSDNFSGFAIIRSFDINRPDTGIEDLKGGVLGGCLFGQTPLKTGEVIEIRPGLVRADKTYTPLKTKINTVFSEQKSVQMCEFGGLYALGTTLDPSITKSDQIVGCVAGYSHQLPPVIQANTIKVTYITIDSTEKTPKLNEDEFYYFMWGNLVARGKPTKLTKNQFKIEYEHPICNYMKKCIIYGKKSSQTTALVGFGNTVE
jgi:translation initiation factor 2 subunit 3